MAVSRKEHWDYVYGSRSPAELSWFQSVPSRSLSMIRETGIPTAAPIIDAGAGVSALIDLLLGADYSNVTALEISGSAIAQSRARLGDSATRVRWVQADVLEWTPMERYQLWHDRAVFHFMIDSLQADKYLATMRAALAPGGYFVLATFGPAGPGRCSGLDVQRYSIEQLLTLLERDLELKSYELELHMTPTGSEQQFLYSCWQMTG